jgi:CMP/dCMP kinase
MLIEGGPPSNAVISIDGPTASGKTTLGYALADRLEAMFLDTGLTYRAVALAASRTRGTWHGHELVARVEHELRQPHSDREHVRVDGREVTYAVFDERLDEVLRKVSRDPLVRSGILEMHQRLLQRRLIVVGRDAGVTLVPNADLRIFLAADLEIRQERRRLQSTRESWRSAGVGPETELDARTRLLLESDRLALVLDSSRLSATAVLDIVWRRVEALAR